MKELEELAYTAGDVEVTPTFSAEGMEDLVVKYTASKGLAVRNSKAAKTDAAEDFDSTYGRIQITLPAGWGPDTDPENDGNITPPPEDAKIHETPQSGPNATSLHLKYSGGVTIRPGRDPDVDSR